MCLRYILTMISLSYLVLSSQIAELNINITSGQNEDANVTTDRLTTADVTTKSNVDPYNIEELSKKSNDTSDQSEDSDGTTDRITTAYVTTKSNAKINNIEELFKKSNDTSDQSENFDATTDRITTANVTTKSNENTNNIKELAKKSNNTSERRGDLNATSDRIPTLDNILGQNTTSKNISAKNVSNLEIIFKDIFSNNGSSATVNSNETRADNVTSNIEDRVANNNGTHEEEMKTTTVKYIDTKRISERKCDEYTNITRRRALHSFSSTSNWEIKYAVAGCAQIYFIRGGVSAKKNEYPHMAAVGWRTYEGAYVFNCGGSLISENFILTAAHCTYDPNAAEPQPSVVFIGENHIDPNSERGSYYTVNIKSIHKHPEYKPPKRYNDIALLKLERNLPVTLEIRPACLWNKDDFEWRHEGIATGWGLTDSGEKASDLQVVWLSLLENDVCDPLLKSIRNRNWQGFTSTQMCAGELKGGKDTCQGDSGAPLQVSYDYCIYYVMGVTSFGHRCAEPDRPAIYTRVSKYLDWIEGIVWPGK